MSLLSRTYSQHYPHRIPSCALKLLVTSRIPVGDTSRWQLKVFWNITGLQRVSNERLKLTVVFWIGIPNTNTSTKYQNENLTTTRYFKGQRLRHFLLFHPYFYLQLQAAAVSWEQLQQQACSRGYFLLFDVPSHSLSAFGIQVDFIPRVYSSLLQSSSGSECWLLTLSQVLVFLQKHQLFLLNLTLRSDLIPATPGIGISESGLVTFLERSWVQLLTRKVKHYFHSFSKLTCRTKDQAENIRKRMGKKSLPGK